jgi:hypothetical protein
MRLLCHSYANNQAFGITGALTYENSKFGQVIKGSKKDINALWQKIQKYNQYKNVRLIEPRPISERSFSKWRMTIKDSKEISKNSQKRMLVFGM